MIVLNVTLGLALALIAYTVILDARMRVVFRAATAVLFAAIVLSVVWLTLLGLTAIGLL